METTISTAEHEAARDAYRMRANQEELVERITRALPQDGQVEPLKGVHLARLSAPLVPVHSTAIPAFCIIAQGSKEVLLGDSRCLYDPQHYLITTLELPRVSRVLEASPERPYLSFLLELNPDFVSAVMLETGFSAPSRRADADANRARAFDVAPLDADLQDAVVRLVRLADPAASGTEEAAILMPLITREIVYRLLAGRQGARLRHIAGLAGSTPVIARAVAKLREAFDQPLRMEALASELGMSVSGLHHQFKAVTAMSPLQFQKQLRLQEARRLMLTEAFDAASAAYRVGYNDASHFSREYKSLFGVPPMRDVQRLRGAVLEPAGS